MYSILNFVIGLEYFKLNFVCDLMPNINEKKKFVHVGCISLSFDPHQQHGPAFS